MIALTVGLAFAGGADGLKIADVPQGNRMTWGVVDARGQVVPAEALAFMTRDPVKVSEIQDYRRLRVRIGVGLAAGGAAVGLGGGLFAYSVSRQEPYDAGPLLVTGLVGTALGVAGFTVAALGVTESRQVSRFYTIEEARAKVDGTSGARVTPTVDVAIGPLGVSGRF
jgi:hypothetical protein